LDPKHVDYYDSISNTYRSALATVLDYLKDSSP